MWPDVCGQVLLLLLTPPRNDDFILYAPLCTTKTLWLELSLINTIRCGPGTFRHLIWVKLMSLSAAYRFIAISLFITRMYCYIFSLQYCVINHQGFQPAEFETY